jgi:hypothetical protein
MSSDLVSQLTHVGGFFANRVRGKFDLEHRSHISHENDIGGVRVFRWDVLMRSVDRMTVWVLQHARVGIDVLEMIRQVASIGINDVARIRRASRVPAPAVGDVAAHEIASEEVEKGEE